MHVYMHAYPFVCVCIKAWCLTICFLVLFFFLILECEDVESVLLVGRQTGMSSWKSLGLSIKNKNASATDAET